MSLTYAEFCILSLVSDKDISGQRAIAEESKLSLGLVNKTIKSLTEKGFIREGSVTGAGQRSLDPYRVDNAVILAAGMSPRLAPITYDHPKGLLRARGEILIERQIRQLKEAGIDDITVVVGYKKSEFFYLEDKFGVQLIVSSDYVNRNNHSSIWAVRDRIGSTYVCSSDNYFTQNPFRKYEYSSFAAAVWAVEAPGEYFLKTKGKMRRIISAKYEGENDWVMMGHAYWNRGFSRKFLQILENEYDNPELRDKLWDEVFYDHADELEMVCKPYPEGVVYEFDSLDQLKDFDPEFIDNVGSGVLANICQVLECDRSEVTGVNPIKQGLTNLSFYFEVGNQGYVYRHPGAGTDEIINREAEAFALQTAHDLGLDATFVYENPQEGWKISKFIPGCTEFDYSSEAHVQGALRIARTLHKSGVVSPWSFDFYDESMKIQELLRGEGWRFPNGYDDLAKSIARLVEPMREGAGEPVLCHNDFFGPNFLVHGDEMDLIDWEYAAMGDYGCDFGNFVSQGSGYSVRRALEVMPYYFGRNPTLEETFHLIACTAVVGWYWYVWSMYKECKGAPAGDWMYVWYKAAKDFGEYANSLLAGELMAVDIEEEAKLNTDGLTIEEFDKLVEKERAGQLTEQEVAALQPYRVQRAVFFAAGFGSRMMPITVNTPKPLVRVHGVRIIDRLIDAVLAAGITEIYIVRGYLKEEFDQLLAKYPSVRFIDNPIYDKTNNISSALMAKDLFQNAYVFESDLYLTNTDFVGKYQYRSSYLGMPVSSTDDWYFDADEDGRITKLAKGKNASCWQMAGLSYWTSDDGARLAKDLPEVFDESDENKQIFWDDVALRCRPDEYRIYIREYQPEDIVEIDSFAELQEIDPIYRVK